MSTEQTRTPASNKSVFGPLGKYAIVAVFIVSIIVTTAIMLEKQLGTTDERLAAIQAELNFAENSQENTDQVSAETTIASDSDVKANTENTAPVATTSTETQTVATTDTADESPVVEKQIAVSQPAETAPANEAAASISTPTPVETVATEKIAEQAPSETVITTTAANEVSTKPVTVAAASQAIKSTATETKQIAVKPVHKNLSSEQRIAQMKARQEKINAEHQARMAAIKAKQKATLTAMFKRIEALEAKQVNNYASSQDRQIAALRKQVQHQQEIIDSIIVHNKEMLNIRKVNIERVQQRRQAILNRI